MENQNGTVDRMVGQLADPPNGFGVGPTGTVADPERPSSLAAGHEASGDPETAVAGSWSASLTGSLSVFGLPDILSMLATTGQTGELEVMGDAAEGLVWLEGGDLAGAEVGSSTTVSQAVFELACATEGWFSFTTGPTTTGRRFGSSESSTGDSVPVMTVLAEVGPRVDEWRAIRELLPLDAVVTLSPEPPGDDVRIRNDQWRVLTKVGTSGHSVKSVLDMIGGDQIAGLRALRDLHSAGLVDLEPLPTPLVADTIRLPSRSVLVDDVATSAAPSPLMIVSADSLADDLGCVPPPSEPDPEIGEGDRFESLAEVAIMPPPIAGDPWAPVAAPDETGGDGMA